MRRSNGSGKGCTVGAIRAPKRSAPRVSVSCHSRFDARTVKKKKRRPSTHAAQVALKSRVGCGEQKKKGEETTMPANVRRLTTVVIMALCAYAIGVSTGAAAQGRF